MKYRGVNSFYGEGIHDSRCVPLSLPVDLGFTAVKLAAYVQPPA
jgi:hypothetical protein